ASSPSPGVAALRRVAALPSRADRSRASLWHGTRAWLVARTSRPRAAAPATRLGLLLWDRARRLDGTEDEVMNLDRWSVRTGVFCFGLPQRGPRHLPRVGSRNRFGVRCVQR